jgi:hypothetical protein
MAALTNLAGFPGREVQFTKTGALNDPADLDGSAAFVSGQGLTDLFVISHGWNNDMDEARALYANVFAKVAGVLAGGTVRGLGGRKFGVLEILWPSKKFAERDLIPSGAAGAASVVSDNDLLEHLEGLKGVFDAPGADHALEQAKALVPRLEDSPQAQREFADLVRSALPPLGGNDPEEATDRFASQKGDTLLKRLKEPVVVLAPKGGQPGGAAGLVGDVLRGAGDAIGGAVRGVQGAIVDAGRGINDAAERFLNLTTYFQMKERAGVVGRGGVYQVLRKVRESSPKVKIHLIGHSFGGRLVTAAALGPDGQPPVKPETMTLLQAAFSHNGFAPVYDGTHDGFFRRVVSGNQVAGPVLITHTANDKAVGIAYALASRISGETGAAIGDANDAFGGIGRNGAIKTPEAVFIDLGPVGSPYAFVPGTLFNLHADVIADHGDIAKDQVAYALLSAVATT